MPRIFCRLLAGLWLLVSLAGCEHGHYGQFCASPTSESLLPRVERGSIEADLNQARVPVRADEVLNRKPKQFPPYRALSARQGQCLAAAASTQGNLLDEERQSAAARAAQHCFKRKSGSQSSVKELILTYSALEARNQSAGTALEIYYTLAELEGKWELLQQSLTILDDNLAKTKDLMKQGLRVPVEYEELFRQRIALQDNETRLETGIQKWNGELRRLLGFETGPDEWRFRPTLDFEIAAPPLDIEQAVATGKTRRPQLILLRELQTMLDADSLPMVQGLLTAVNALLGMEEKPKHLLLAALGKCLCHDHAEEATSLRQLQEYLAERERIVVTEIRQAARDAQSQLELAVLAGERVRSWHTKILDLESKEAKGLASSGDTLAARLEWLKARGDLIKEMSAWHIAHAKLKQAQGVLVEECSSLGTEACPGEVHDKMTR